MSLLKFISPVIRWTSPFWGVIASGAYEYAKKEALDMSLVTSLAAWTWFFGVIFGYLIHDLTVRNRHSSFLLTWWDNRKNPLAFGMSCESYLPHGPDSQFKAIGAHVFNSSGLKRKNVCMVSKESRGCDSVTRTDIQFCADIPAQTTVFIPMFNVRQSGSKVEYRVVPDYLKSGNINTDWCDMNEAAFSFKPCFSDDMNQEKCLRLCTVLMPAPHSKEVSLIETYYAEDDEKTNLLT